MKAARSLGSAGGPLGGGGVADRLLPNGSYRPVRICRRRAMARAERFKQVRTSIFGNFMGATFGTKAEAASPGVTTAPAAPASPGSGSNLSSTPTPAIDIAPVLDKAVAAKKARRTAVYRLATLELIGYREIAR